MDHLQVDNPNYDTAPKSKTAPCKITLLANRRGHWQMIIRVDRTGSVEQFRHNIDLVLKDDSVKSLMIFACDANEFTTENIDANLTDLPVPVFGAIFPQIIHGSEKLEKGTLIVGLQHKANVQVVPHLSDAQVDYETLLDQRIPKAANIKTIFVLVDGFAKRIGALIDGLFNMFGLEVNYLGGGAGSLSFCQKPCLFTNDGLVMDAAVLALIEMSSGVGVSHGWVDVSGPFKVTASDRNTIQTIDWKPAFQVYREIVEKHSGKIFDSQNFFDIAKGYPFGISKLGAEKIVRDPIAIADNDSLVCVGEVPQDSFINILTGTNHSLINAAGAALSLANQAFPKDRRPAAILFIDCISRVLFLNDHFRHEIDAVRDGELPLIGALTLGEIANSGREYLEFYNKTSVVGILE